MIVNVDMMSPNQKVILTDAVDIAEKIRGAINDEQIAGDPRTIALKADNELTPRLNGSVQYEPNAREGDEIEKTPDSTIVPKWSIFDAHGVSVIKLHEKRVHFSKKEQSIMEHLVRAGGEPVEYEILHAFGWPGDPYDPDIVKKTIGNLKVRLNKMESGDTVKIANETAQLVEYQRD